MSDSNKFNVNVALGDNSYDIKIGANVVEGLSAYIKSSFAGRNIFFVIDQSIAHLFADKIIRSVESNLNYGVNVFSVPAGESSKSQKVYFEILNWLAESGAKRDSIIIAIGGGVIGDLAGFVAASYMRGISFIQVPTTLLAQVDSSVGGKTAINIAAGKNLVGAFYQPERVYCDINLLDSLPDREMRAGYAEIYKYGLLWDADFLNWLHNNSKNVLAREVDALSYAVMRCCQIKAEIVSQDEKESGVRALLNLGHTFGHALEALCQYDDRLRHGEAVSIGMVMAAELSCQLGHIDVLSVETIRDHLKQCGLPVAVNDIHNAPDITVDNMLDYMAKDKKASSAGLKFITLRQLGKAVVQSDIAQDDVIDVLKKALA